MNIFYLDNDPKLAAQYQCDKHVVKMVLETAQLLSTAVPVEIQSKISDSIFYKHTHLNHPCSKWARESIANFKWLVSHGLHLAGEYHYRYGKVHKSITVIVSAEKAIPLLKFNTSLFTVPALAMPDEYKTNNPVESYRNYYKLDKLVKISCHWTKREIPSWIL